MSRVECQPPMLDAPIDGCSARRRKMISANSALRSSAPGSITAATGVANNPFTSTSVPDMPGALQTILLQKKKGWEPRLRASHPVGQASTGSGFLVRNFSLPALEELIVVLRNALRLLVGKLALRSKIAVLL